MAEERAVYMLSQEQFVHYWPGIQECLGKTDFHKYYTNEWLIEEVGKQNVQVWVLSDGQIRLVFFSRIISYPRFKVLQLFWGYGGMLDEFIEIGNDTMEAVAQRVGASRIEIVGRPGWLRKLRKLPGVELSFYVISRPVKPERVH